MILYGKPVAEKIYKEIKLNIATKSPKPILAVVLVGENASSLAYVKLKEKRAKDLGIGFELYHFPNIVNQEALEKLIDDLNCNKYVTGILVQLPLPKKIDEKKILSKIKQKKDVDGLTGKKPTVTALAIMEILKYYHIDLANKNIVIVGHGKLVGAPLEKLLKEKKYKVTVCDKSTSDIKDKILTADIIITATGVPGLITADMVKKSAVIIDAGMAEIDGKIQGDVDAKVYEKVSAYTPSPGGVGPVTVACLMKNLTKSNNLN